MEDYFDNLFKPKSTIAKLAMKLVDEGKLDFARDASPIKYFIGRIVRKDGNEDEEIEKLLEKIDGVSNVLELDVEAYELEKKAKEKGLEISEIGKELETLLNNYFRERNNYEIRNRK